MRRSFQILLVLYPRELWEQSGRWAGMGENMFRLKDRKGADLCLGMTHEEIMTSIARNELRSYKQLPRRSGTRSVPLRLASFEFRFSRFCLPLTPDHLVSST